jgi:sec-independent protein translocase protein TatA
VIQVFAAIFPNLGTTELLLILFLVLLIFGPSKLPQIGAAIGKGIRELRKASKDISDNAEESNESKEEKSG